MPSLRLLPLCLAALLSTAGAAAAPVNLLRNGSFENGLADWSSASSGARTIAYGSTDAGRNAFGETVRADGLGGASPDAAGGSAAFFSDDYAVDATLSQVLALSAGTYRFGFDAYAPANGMGNPIDAGFRLGLAGVRLGDFRVSSMPTAAWTQYAGTVNIASAGNYSLDFVFNAAGGGFAKDVAIDRVYVIAASPASNVPEPASLALVLLGIVGVIAIHRRRDR